MDMTQEQLVRELRSGLPIHKHPGDPEPRLSPLSVSRVHAIMATAANVIETLSADRESEMHQNADLLKEVMELQAQIPRWISVEDEQKPRKGKYYLCVCTLPNDPEHKLDWLSVRWWNATTGNGYVDRPHFSDEGVEGMTVTHWMPLPLMPKEETK